MKIRKVHWNDWWNIDTGKSHWAYLMMIFNQSPNSAQLNPQTTCFPNRENPRGRCLNSSSPHLVKGLILWSGPCLPFLFLSHDTKAHSHYPSDFLSLPPFSDFISVLVSTSHILSPHNHTAGSFYLDLSSNISPSDKFFPGYPFKHYTIYIPFWPIASNYYLQGIYYYMKLFYVFLTQLLSISPTRLGAPWEQDYVREICLMSGSVLFTNSSHEPHRTI